MTEYVPVQIPDLLLKLVLTVVNIWSPVAFDYVKFLPGLFSRDKNRFMITYINMQSATVYDIIRVWIDQIYCAVATSKSGCLSD